MGGGDLNLKKSWHPMLMSNQKKVWEEEQKALEERKRIDQMMKERAEERQIQELQELQEAAGGTKRQQRVDWMYSGPASGQQGTTEEMEGYLLGKRRIDGLLKGTENQKLEKSAKEESFMAVQNANTLRDTAAKVREDPMLAIKRQEQAAYEAMMSDPVRRRLLLKAAGQEPIPSEREHKRRKHRHHLDREDEGKHRRHRSTRYEDGDRSSDRSGKRRSRQDEDDRTDSRKGNRSRRSRSRSESVPRSPTHHHRRSESPRRQYPRSRGLRDRSRSPRYDCEVQRDIRKSKSWHNDRRHQQQRSSPPFQRRSSPDTQKDALARLTAMQQDASHLDEHRQRRLRELADKDETNAQREEDERARNARYGGRADFVDRFNKRAGELSVGDRIGRSGQSRRHTED